MSTIVLGVCGSIAAYKAADLTSKLSQKGHDVFVVLSEHASQFVAPLTFQTLSRNPVLSRLEDEKDSWRPGHIDLADRADLILIAPATANVIAKLASGFADDPMTSIVLATKAPLLVAPAMNGKMWEHPATKENVEKLTKRGVQFVDPESGMLACGYEGAGRLADVEAIIASAEKLLRAV